LGTVAPDKVVYVKGRLVSISAQLS
jgi:hypothetical protein